MICQSTAYDIHYNGNKDYSFYLIEQVHPVLSLNSIDKVIVMKTI